MPAPSSLQLTAEYSALTVDAAAALITRTYEIDIDGIERLATERDDSFCLHTANGRLIAKFAHPLDEWSVLHDQVRVLQGLARIAPELPVQRVVPSRDAESLVRVKDESGTPRLLRVLSYLEGELLGATARPLDAITLLGSLHARLGRAIAAIGDDAHPPLVGASTPWNLLNLDECAPHVDTIGDPALRDEVATTINRATPQVLPGLRALSTVLAHNDLHGDNVLVRTEPFAVTGVLDFGDMCRTPRVADLAVAASYARGRVTADAGPWDAARAYVSGYEAEQPLTDAEHALLPELVLLRLAQRGILNSAIAAANPTAAGYASRNLSAITRDLRELGASIPSTIGEAR